MTLDEFFTVCDNLPDHSKSLLPAATDEEIDHLVHQIGPLPEILLSLIRHFNGGELFISGLPFLSFFRSSATSMPQDYLWSAVFTIDQFTLQWREGEKSKSNFVAIAMTNYGGLILVNGTGQVSEWDTQQGRWLFQGMAFAEWLSIIVKKGMALLED